MPIGAWVKTRGLCQFVYYGLVDHQGFEPEHSLIYDARLLLRLLRITGASECVWPLEGSVGFEPTGVLPPSVFKTGAISRTLPRPRGTGYRCFQDIPFTALRRVSLFTLNRSANCLNVHWPLAYNLRAASTSDSVRTDHETSLPRGCSLFSRVFLA